MASNPPFELEDQTDADFFDQLVSDDDDDNLTGGFKSTVLAKADQISEGDETDEAKTFANLSVSDVGNGNDGLEAKVAAGGDSNVGEQKVEAKEKPAVDVDLTHSLSSLSLDSSSFDLGVVSEDVVLNSETRSAFGGEISGSTASNVNLGEQEVVGKEQPIIHGDAIHGLTSEGSFSIDNGHVSEDGAMASEVTSGLRRESIGSMGSGVKQVQWGSFGESGEHGNDGFGSYSDFFSNFGEGAVENLQGDIQTGIGNEASNNISTQNSYSNAEFPGVSGSVADQSASNTIGTQSSYSHVEYQGESGAVAEQSAMGQDLNSVEYWESLYPGWKYDPNTGQWYQLDSSTGAVHGQQENFDAGAGNAQGNFDVGKDSDQAVSDFESSQVSNAQETPQISGKETFDAGARNLQGNFNVGGDSYQPVSDFQSSQVAYAQQTAQSSVETVSQSSASESVSSWSHVSQQNGEHQYPAHMIFDPQYPGWYYDTIAQEWRSLDAYHSSAQSMDHAQSQQAQNGFSSAAECNYGNSQSITNNALQSFGSEGLNQTWDYIQPGTNTRQSEVGTESNSALGQSWQGSFDPNTRQSEVGMEIKSALGQSWQGSYDPFLYSNNNVNQQKAFDSRETMTSYETASRSYDSSSWSGGVHNFVPTTGGFQQFNHQMQEKQNVSFQNPTDYYSNQNGPTNSQPLFPNARHAAAYSPSEGRSSAGRPPHALVTFGFGGKLIVMKDNSGGFSSFGSKDPDGRSMAVCNLMEVVGVNNNLGTGTVISSYFSSLCHQSFPGPLVGGSAGNKELNKWIEERITNCELPDMDYNKSKALRLLLSLLKVACRHYGKLRSYGAETGIMESELPESAVAKLFASAKNTDGQFDQFRTMTNCFLTLPSETQIKETATEVQHLLISGQKKEALQRAQEGQFWEFALILAQQLGDQFYADTVKQMAISQLAVGSPLRTLCLLIAKKPEEVFSNNVNASGNMPGAMHGQQLSQNAGYSMLDNWEENLAVITANRTENDHLVIIHLGDCLWKERNDVTAAHICYLVAEADLEMYSESARMCLIGADHLSFPRTYASPEAIQRTEFFEYTKVLGNSQFVLLPLQPYKLIYAHMLAEVGRVSDSLKYCQAIYKCLKTGRSHEVDTMKQLLSSLEERIKTHQQSGYAANLAPAKIVGKLLNFFDSTAHRVVGGLPPPVPSTSQANVQGNEQHFQRFNSKVSENQSNTGMPSLTPSASMEPISQWAVDGGRMTLQNRSISEPNIGSTPKPDHAELTNEQAFSGGEGKKSGAPGTSRFGRLNFGAQIFQKTVGLVLKPRQGRQAKLGETNKFYYDEKLKRWVEEGADPPAEEMAPPPPPTTAAFQNGMSDYNLNNTLNNQFNAAAHTPEPSSSAPLGSNTSMPAIPPSSNQFSARGRMGVRSRYVDTFNKGGGNVGSPSNTFQPPTAPSAKPVSATAPKFFIPTPSPSNEQTSGSESGVRDHQPSENGENSSFVHVNDPFQNLAPSPAGNMQRFPSVDNISNKGNPGSGNYGSFGSSQSRRTSSWSDIHSNVNAYNPPTMNEMKASPPSFMPSNHSGANLPMNGGSIGNGDDLQEVEL